MTSRRAVWSRALLVVLFLAPTAGCGTSGLGWVQDDRVAITQPADRQQVALPTSVRWQARDVAIGPGTGSYGVFVDRAPQPPGKTMGWIFRDGAECGGARAKTLCESAEFLAGRDVFTTIEPQFTIERVTPFTGTNRRRKFHELTVILIDGDGRRVGESAWSVQFAVKDAN